ncbi:uncharacterized protein LOC119547913 [Drosophila subpulchrella]|uniref:uncharacterized protein LOC119547913 n=1 Tax=Drosophila subpulchrella TaxID=1486046 RepID=UPI0018A188DD|nr:uncharacterized protein LOC119547913 [Drosophila subpulchrella]
MWQEYYFGLEQNATLQIMEKTSIRNTAFGMKIEDERSFSFSQLNELSTEMPLTCVEKVKLFQRTAASEAHTGFGQDFQMVPSNTASPQVVSTPWDLVEHSASCSTESYICQYRNLLEPPETAFSSLSGSGCTGTATFPGNSIAAPAMGPWRPWALKEEVTELYSSEKNLSEATSPVAEKNQNHDKVHEPEQSSKVVEVVPPKKIERASVKSASKRKKEEARLKQEVEELKRMMREKRKHKEAFVALLDSLHEKGILTYMSQWDELYPIISKDYRFLDIFGPHDSTPLDLFNDYVEILKSDVEQKIIRKILKERSFVVQSNTSYKDFARIVFQDRRSARLDEDNVMVTYGSLLKKAKEDNRERIKALRELRKLEYEVKDKWLRAEVSVAEPYRNAKKLVEHLEAFDFYDRKIGVRKIWKDFINECEDEVSQMCNNHYRNYPESKNKKNY